MRDNDLIDFVRGRVEHVIAMITNHNLFKKRPGYRGAPPVHALLASTALWDSGSLGNLKTLVAITLHATSALISVIEPTRQLDGYGPWSHKW